MVGKKERDSYSSEVGPSQMECEFREYLGDVG